MLELPAKVESLARETESLRTEVSALRNVLPPQLRAVPDAAAALGVSVSTLRRRARSGEIPVVRLGRAVRIDLAALRPVDRTEVVRLAESARRPR